MTASKELVSLMLFHDKFGMPTHPYPHMLEKDFMDFRVRFLEEELTEIKEAYEAGDMVKVADSLVDLVYVALGTAELMSLPWDACWAAVQKANMTKKRALHESESKRFSTYDVVKPPGWVSPNEEITRILDMFRKNGLQYDRRSAILRSGHTLPD